jgi:hypothetical protein
VFKACASDPNCNSEYPNLEDIYYKVIEALTKSPITVKADKSIIEEETFTYNAEDFKIAIHQALYQKGLIEVLPLLRCIKCFIRGVFWRVRIRLWGVLLC